jgi:dihydroxy-acid dehydratase
LRQNIAGAEAWLPDVIRSTDNPVAGRDGIAVLYGNLAPRGAVMKPAAADPRLRAHRGPALVFASYDEMAARVDRDDLDVTPDHVLVLQNAGPQGAPGMPEWGMLPIPKKLVRAGVRDMLRISDARMSGTSYGACVLHVTPEAHVGGPLGLARTGDWIAVNVENRSLRLEVGDEELGRRGAAFSPRPPRLSRGYGALFARSIRQADEGCDFDFLERGEALSEPEIH